MCFKSKKVFPCKSAKLYSLTKNSPFFLKILVSISVKFDMQILPKKKTKLLKFETQEISTYPPSLFIQHSKPNNRLIYANVHILNAWHNKNKNKNKNKMKRHICRATHDTESPQSAAKTQDVVNKMVYRCLDHRRLMIFDSKMKTNTANICSSNIHIHIHIQNTCLALYLHLRFRFYHSLSTIILNWKK